MPLVIIQYLGVVYIYFLIITQKVLILINIWIGNHNLISGKPKNDVSLLNVESILFWNKKSRSYVLSDLILGNFMKDMFLELITIELSCCWRDMDYYWSTWNWNLE